MSFKYFIGGSVFLSLALTPGAVHSAPVKIGHYVIPGTFARSLEQGMTVPVFIRYQETDEKSQQKTFCWRVISTNTQSHMIEAS